MPQEKEQLSQAGHSGKEIITLDIDNAFSIHAAEGAHIDFESVVLNIPEGTWYIVEREKFMTILAKAGYGYDVQSNS